MDSHKEFIASAFNSFCSFYRILLTKVENEPDEKTKELLYKELLEIIKGDNLLTILERLEKVT